MLKMSIEYTMLWEERVVQSFPGCCRSWESGLSFSVCLWSTCPAWDQPV